MVIKNVVLSKKNKYLMSVQKKTNTIIDDIIHTISSDSITLMKIKSTMIQLVQFYELFAIITSI